MDFKDLEEIRSFVTELELEIKQLRESAGKPKDNLKDDRNFEVSDTPVAEPVFDKISDDESITGDENLFDLKFFTAPFEDSKEYIKDLSGFPTELNSNFLKADDKESTPKGNTEIGNDELFDFSYKDGSLKMSSKDYVDSLELSFTPPEDFEFTAELPVSEPHFLPESEEKSFEDDMDRLFYGYKSAKESEGYDESAVLKETTDLGAEGILTEEIKVASEIEDSVVEEVLPDKSEQPLSEIDEIVRILEELSPAEKQNRRTESFEDGFFVERREQFETDIPKTDIEAEEREPDDIAEADEDNISPLLEQPVTVPLSQQLSVDDASIDVLERKLNIGVIIGELRPRYSELNLSVAGKDPIIRFKKVTTKYRLENESGDSELLFEGLSLNIKKNSITAIISDEPIRSRIFLASVKDRACLKSGEVVFFGNKNGSDIVYFDSDNVLIPDLSVLHFLMLCLDASKEKTSVKSEKLTELLGKLGLSDISHTEIKHLTKFQKTMVLLISAAIINSVRGIVVNSFFEELAIFEKKTFYEVFSLLRENGKSVLMPSTGSDEVLNVANRVAVLKADSVAFEGTILEYMNLNCPSRLVIRNADENIFNTITGSFNDIDIEKTETGLKVSYFGDETGLSNLLMLILESGIDHTEIITTRRTFSDIRLKGGERL